MAPFARTARRLGGVALNVLLAVVVLGCAAYILPAALGYERYVITGGSMSGSIEKGSVVLEQPRPVAELAVGDVITYQPPAGSGTTDLVTHRIAEITEGEDGRPVLTTKGDANADVDPWTFSLLSDEQPVVVASVPLVGHALIALADRETRMLVIGVPAAAIALLALVELVRALGRPSPGTTDAPAKVEAGTPATP